jgi:hypothetical protein
VVRLTAFTGLYSAGDLHDSDKAEWEAPGYHVGLSLTRTDSQNDPVFVVRRDLKRSPKRLRGWFDPQRFGLTACRTDIQVAIALDTISPWST